jgi:hypothetical protein
MFKLARQALRKPGDYSGFLYIGEHRSAFVLASRGTLLFARAISLGLDALITSLTRPIRMPNATDAVSLTYETAREILHSHGFADRQQVVHEPTGLTGGQVIPLLQPTVQRFIIELRQSLRFGMPEEQRQSIRMLLSGPGSTVPNFGKIVSRELQVGVDVDARYAKYTWHEPGSTGSELVDAQQDRAPLLQLGLAPQVMTRARQAARLRRWLWTGAAAAIGVVAMDAARFHGKLVEVQNQANSIAANATSIKSLQNTADKLLAGIGAMNALEASISSETAANVDVRACLQEFSRITPESIRLTTIALHQQDGRTVGSVHGYAFANPEVKGKAQLEPFINALRKSPLFETVVLTQVQVGTLGDQTGQRFEATFSTVPAPRKPPENLAIVAQGARP